MNLTDYRKTPVHRALEAVRREAERYGVSVEEGEVVGLIPEDALLDAAEFYLQLNVFDRQQILERKVRAATAGAVGRPLADSSLAGFAAKLAARTPTPGGGSASAAAGAFGAALGEMVIAYSVKPGTPDPGDDRRRSAARRAARVPDGRGRRGRYLLRSGPRRAPQDEGGAGRCRWLGRPGNTRFATRPKFHSPPPGQAREASALLEKIRSKVKATIASDLTTAMALLAAAADGALANVAINLAELATQNVPHDDLAAGAAGLASSSPR